MTFAIAKKRKEAKSGENISYSAVIACLNAERRTLEVHSRLKKPFINIATPTVR